MKKRKIAQILGVLVVMTSGVTFGQTQVPDVSPVRTNLPVSTTDQSALIATIKSQQEMIQALQQELIQVLEELEQFRMDRPDRNAPKYWAQDKDGNKIFDQAKFDADMRAWQSRMNRLISDVNTMQARLAQEEAKLANLQSQVDAAKSKDDRRREEALEREMEQQQTRQQQGIVPGHAYNVIGTFENDGRKYVVLRNPWGNAETEGSDSPLAQEQTSRTATKQALAYCKGAEKTNKMCGFTLAPACPEEWSVGKSFTVGGRKYKACIKALVTK
ncbi:MAG: C2 family cysteine protease [Planctomycetota bacterium]|jgi:outer membrane murein-binding lipoprotein Lpp